MQYIRCLCAEQSGKRLNEVGEKAMKLIKKLKKNTLYVWREDKTGESRER